MSRDWFFELQRCLHITNPSTYEHIAREDERYDKMRQVQWLVDKVRDTCMRSWIPEKFLTIDEMMVQYKGTYCPAQQYMPIKPQK